MVLTDQGVAKSGSLQPVSESLKGEGLEYDVFDQVEPEPSIQSLMEASRMAKEGKFDVFIALGGGSSMDTTQTGLRDDDK